MIKKVYGIYDLKAQVYGPPLCFNTNAEGLRFFTDLANDKNGSIGKHPDDYVLFEIGIFDDQTGSIASTVPPVKLGLAVEFKEVIN